MKILRRNLTGWLLPVLMFMALGQVLQTWHHADLVAHESGGLCQVCLHASGSAVTTGAKLAVLAPAWFSLGSVLVGLSRIFSRTVDHSHRQRAPPHDS